MSSSSGVEYGLTWVRLSFELTELPEQLRGVPLYLTVDESRRAVTNNNSAWGEMNETLASSLSALSMSSSITAAHSSTATSATSPSSSQSASTTRVCSSKLIAPDNLTMHDRVVFNDKAKLPLSLAVEQVITVKLSVITGSPTAINASTIAFNSGGGFGIGGASLSRKMKEDESLRLEELASVRFVLAHAAVSGTTPSMTLPVEFYSKSAKARSFSSRVCRVCVNAREVSDARSIVRVVFGVSECRAQRESAGAAISNKLRPTSSKIDAASAAASSKDSSTRNQLALSILRRSRRGNAWHLFTRTSRFSPEKHGKATFPFIELPLHADHFGSASAAATGGAAPRGGSNREVRVEVLRMTQRNGLVRIGAVEFALSWLLDVGSGESLPLMWNNAPVENARLQIVSAQKRDRPSFLDWLRTGACCIDAAIAIDFTASNRDPAAPTSLHNRAAAGRMRHAVRQQQISLKLDAAAAARGDESNQQQQVLFSGADDDTAETLQMQADARNVYAETMDVFSRVVLPYAEQRVVAVGFGGRLPPSWNVSHCFSLHGRQAHRPGEAEQMKNKQQQTNTALSVCNSEYALLDAYIDALEHVTPSGPTLIGPSLKAVRVISSGDDYTAASSSSSGSSAFSRTSSISRGGRSASGSGVLHISSRAESAQTSSQGPPSYSIALIVTDGVPADLNEVRDELVAMSSRGVSVIIAGVGTGQMDKWEHLVASIQPLSNASARTARAMCQFVRMRQNDPDSIHALADALAAVPLQMLDFLGALGAGAGSSGSRAKSLSEQLLDHLERVESYSEVTWRTNNDSATSPQYGRRLNTLNSITASYTKPSNGKLLRVPTRADDDTAAV